MNIFQKIGNTIEENKKREKKRLDRYWKLSSNKRVEYDNRLEDIERTFKFPITRVVMFIFLGCMFLLILSMFSFGDFSLTSIKKIQEFGGIFLTFFWISIIFDLLFDYVKILGMGKERKKLNKRFKL